MSLSDIINITDQYGYNPRLFIGGYPKNGTLIGVFTSIFSWLFLIVIFFYYAYKLLKNKELQTITSQRYFTKEDLVSIDKDNFFFTFTLEDPNTYDYFIDETIYYPTVYHRTGVRMENGLFNYSNSTKLEAVRCKLEYFGSNYQEMFKNYSLSEMYCIKDLNKKLFGTFSDNEYSFIILNLYPCKNKTNSSVICKPQKEINYYLNGTFLSFQYQDINLDPKDFNNPTKNIIGDYMTTVSLNYIKTAYIYLKKILLKTDTGFIFEDIKKKSFTSYDYTTDYINFKASTRSFFALNIRMSSNVEEVLRTYTKAQTMLGYIGGFCTFINNFFFWFNYIFMHNIIHEKIINKIFFNSNVKIKEKNNNYLTKFFTNKDLLNKNILSINNNNNNNNNQHYSSYSNISNYNNYNNNSTSINFNFNNSNNLTEDMLNNFSKKNYINLMHSIKKIKKSFNININNSNNNIQKNKNIINYIKYKKIYLKPKNKAFDNSIKLNYLKRLFLQCYCSLNKTPNNKKTLLLIKGYNLIKEKLDIIGIIKHLNENEFVKKIYLKNEHNLLLDYYIKDDVNEYNCKNYNLDANFSEDENCIKAFETIVKRKENNIYINDNNTEFIDDIFINAVRKQTI